MAEQLKWSFTVQAVRGPAVSGAGTLDLDEYLKSSVTVPAGGNLKVEVMPGVGGSARLVVINPANPDKDLTYDAGGGKVALDGPHVLIGAGAAGLLGHPVGTLQFANAGTKDADVSILVARDATP